jgi:uncharacterized membrane protein
MSLQAIHSLADLFVTLLELIGVAVIVAGIVLSTILLLRANLRGEAWQDSYEQYRANLGRGILLGLEFLVGADIIATVTAPLTVESVSLLAGIIAIRTFLSFALETEIEGCWPWQRARIHGNRRHLEDTEKV